MIICLCILCVYVSSSIIVLVNIKLQMPLTSLLTKSFIYDYAENLTNRISFFVKIITCLK